MYYDMVMVIMGIVMVFLLVVMMLQMEVVESLRARNRQLEVDNKKLRRRMSAMEHSNALSRHSQRIYEDLMDFRTKND